MADFEQQVFAAPDGLALVGDVGGRPDAPAVVLLHGGGQTRHSWAGAMAALVQAGYRVVNYDARGHGDSDWSPQADYTLPAFAADLQAVLDTLPGPVALVGASMGGMTSFFAVGSRPQPRVRALVMVDITLRAAAAGAAKIRAFMSAHPEGFDSVEAAAAAVAAYNPSRPRPLDPSGLLKNLRRRENGRLYWHWDPRLLAVRPSAEPPEAGRDLERVSGNVRIPTLLVKGGHSDIVDEDGVAQMQRLVPQTEVWDVPEAGHMVAGDRNDAFNAGVLAFLRRHLPVR